MNPLSLTKPSRRFKSGGWLSPRPRKGRLLVRRSPRLLAFLWSVDGSVRNVLVAGAVCFTAGTVLSLLLIAGGVLGLLVGYVVFVADQAQAAGGVPAARFQSPAPLPVVASAQTAAQESVAGSATPALPHFSIEVIERDLAATPEVGGAVSKSEAEIGEPGPEPDADSEPGAYPEPDADLEPGAGLEPGADLEFGTDLESGADLEPGAEPIPPLVDRPAAGRLSQRFGCSVYYTGRAGPGCPAERPWFHDGVDIAAQPGTPVYAAMTGMAIFAGPAGGGPRCQEKSRGYGLAIIIDDGRGWQALYAHLSEIEATVGQMVSPETVIGRVGETGCVSGPHLHFGLRHNDMLVDPAAVLNRLDEKEARRK